LEGVKERMQGPRFFFANEGEKRNERRVSRSY
jgi:hypothetical protein